MKKLPEELIIIEEIYQENLCIRAINKEYVIKFG